MATSSSPPVSSIEKGNALTVKGIRKSFDALRALDNLSLSVKERQITVLMGPNGSGKTTLINVISGFYAPDSGEILFYDRKINGLPPEEIYKLGIVRSFQTPALFFGMTVLENILVAQRNNPGEQFRNAFFKPKWEDTERQAVDKAMGILDLLGLSNHWRSEASHLSGGQMKLVEIARALMTDAKVLLLDEPISGVNPTLAHEIFRIISKLRDELAITFLVVEHRLDIALDYADSVSVLALGQLVTTGSSQEVVNNPKVIEVYLGNK